MNKKIVGKKKVALSGEPTNKKKKQPPKKKDKNQTQKKTNKKKTPKKKHTENKQNPTPQTTSPQKKNPLNPTPPTKKKKKKEPKNHQPKGGSYQHLNLSEKIWGFGENIHHVVSIALRNAWLFKALYSPSTISSGRRERREVVDITESPCQSSLFFSSQVWRDEDQCVLHAKEDDEKWSSRLSLTTTIWERRGGVNPTDRVPWGQEWILLFP